MATLPTIVFTDAQSVPRTLTQLGLRFNNWQPSSIPIGATCPRLGSGLRDFFQYREDYMASFEITVRPNAVWNLLQLQQTLLQGLPITVNLQDTASSSYTCILAPGAKPTITLDRVTLDYSMTMKLLNTSIGHMVCLYEAT